MNYDTNSEVSLRRKNFLNFDNLTLYFQIGFMTLLTINYYGDNSLQKKEAYFCNYCILIQFFSFLIVNLRLILLFDICKLKGEIIEIFFTTICLLLNVFLIINFFNKNFGEPEPPIGMVDFSERKKIYLFSILKLKIVILAGYRVIIEGTNLIFTTGYIGLVLVKSVQNKEMLKKLQNSESEEQFKLVLAENYEVDCAICLENINFLFPDGYVRLKCHKSHIFHMKCMTTWCQEKVSCPICKKCIFDS